MIEAIKYSPTDGKTVISSEILNDGQQSGQKNEREKLNIAYEGTPDGGNITIVTNKGEPNCHKFRMSLAKGSQIESKDLGLKIRAI